MIILLLFLSLCAFDNLHSMDHKAHQKIVKIEVSEITDGNLLYCEINSDGSKLQRKYEAGSIGDLLGHVLKVASIDEKRWEEFRPNLKFIMSYFVKFYNQIGCTLQQIFDASRDIINKSIPNEKRLNCDAVNIVCEAFYPIFGNDIVSVNINDILSTLDIYKQQGRSKEQIISLMEDSFKIIPEIKSALWPLIMKKIDSLFADNKSKSSAGETRQVKQQTPVADKIKLVALNLK